ncbi:lasso peptide biosynthesis B2 protein [Candidatus Dependentiae bacterium]|nr:lasso peptide biosynthesis B2 protein [Candidatus Dependentiae bacterium]
MKINSIEKFFLVLNVLFLGVIVNIFLGVVNFTQLIKKLKPERVSKNSRHISIEEIYRISYKVLYTSLFGYLIFRPTCLRKSLVLYRVFNQYGYPVMINLGVKKESGSVTAHSWLTLDGDPIFENSEILSEYNMIYNYQ